MSHRVIAGSAKGRRLKMVPGDGTRPIMDRAKEALFSIIGREIMDSRVLDLFGGTGAVGIEALSRGASYVLFVELSGKAQRVIEENLAVTGLHAKADVRRADSLALISGMPPKEPFDFIYVAPPQYKGIWLKVLQTLDSNPGWIPEQTTVIVQIDPKEYREFEGVTLKHLEVVDERKYGRTQLLFLASPLEDEVENE